MTRHILVWWLRALCGALLVATSLSAQLPSVDAPPSISQERLSMDALIDALPHVRDQSYWDRANSTVVIDPAVVELQERLNSGLAMSDAQWRRALIETGAISYRKSWPKTKPFALGMSVPRWLTLTRIRLSPRRTTFRDAKAGILHSGGCGFSSSSRRKNEAYQVLGHLPVGEHELEFDVAVERGPNWNLESSDLTAELLWEGTLNLNVVVVDDLETAIPGVSSESLQYALRSSTVFRMEQDDWTEEVNTPNARLYFEPDTAAIRELGGVALSLRIELLHQGEIVQTDHCVIDEYRLLARGPLAVILRGPHGVSEYLCTLTSLAPAEQNNLSAWSVRLSGTQDRILSAWDARGHWTGTVTIPLEELVRNDLVRSAPAAR